MMINILLATIIVVLVTNLIASILSSIGLAKNSKFLLSKISPFMDQTNNNIAYLHKEIELLKNADSKPNHQ